MHPRRLYVTFCVSIVTLVGCFWYVAYPHNALEELIGKPMHLDIQVRYSVLGFSRENFVLVSQNYPDLKHCLDRSEIVIAPNLGDPCSDAEASHFLASQLMGVHFCPRDAKSYLSHYKLFNTAISVKPKIVITPLTVNDIRLSLKLAKQQNLTVTVRDGGHNPAGYSVSEGGMAIDMAYFNNVRFADETPTDACEALWTARFPSDFIVAQGGSIWQNVHPLLEERNLSVVGGGCATVGVVGLALGGGIGWISRHRGLVSDNVLSFRIVLPDGEVAIVDDANDPELMWGLRGAGGSNFGVVTDVVLRTFPAYTAYLAGALILDRQPEGAIELLDIYGEKILNEEGDPRLSLDLFVARDLRHDHSDEITMRMTFGLIFDGPIEEGVEILRPFMEKLSAKITAAEACQFYGSRCSSPDEIQKARQWTKKWIQSSGPFRRGLTFTDWAKQFGMEEAAVYWTSGFTNAWTHEKTIALVDRLRYAGIDYVPQRTSASLNFMLEHMGGAVGQGPSLWKHKDARVLVSMQSFVMPGINKRISSKRIMVMDALKRWAESSYQSMKSYFTGSYANYAFHGLEDWEDKYYGEENYKRLVKLKSRIKNAEIFNSPQRIETETLEQVYSRAGSEVKKSLTEDDFQLARASLRSMRSDLCPDWLLKMALPILPSFASSQEDDREGNAELPHIEDAMIIEEIKGRNVVLTGGTSGIGFAAVLHLLRLGANVIATSQSSSTCDARMVVIKKIFSHFNNNAIGTFHCLAVALDDATSVQKLVEDISVSYNRVDVLILNAAHNGSGGWSQNMANVSKAVSVGHLGQFYLTLLLLQNSLMNVHSGRIVIQSSGAAFVVEEKDLIDLAVQRPRDKNANNGQVHTKSEKPIYFSDDAGFRTYAATKAMNVAFALELARRLRSTKTHERLRVFLAIPPGTVKTNLSMTYLDNPNYRQQILNGPNAAVLTPAEAALSCVYASVASLDLLDYPPITQFVAKEDFAHSTKEELLGVGKKETRRLQWQYEKQPAISNYVLGCQVGSIAARFRNINWMQTNTTCNLWNWGIEMVNDATHGALITKPGASPLGDLSIENCNRMN